MSNGEQEAAMEIKDAQSGKAYVKPMSGDWTEIAVETPASTFPQMLVIPTGQVEDLYEALKAALGK